MGATDPAKAEAGTLRKEFGRSIENNATHGSDAPETAGIRARIFLFRDGTLAIIAPSGSPGTPNPERGTGTRTPGTRHPEPGTRNQELIADS